jgi:hypothetical protein
VRAEDTEASSLEVAVDACDKLKCGHCTDMPDTTPSRFVTEEAGATHVAYGRITE